MRVVPDTLAGTQREEHPVALRQTLRSVSLLARSRLDDARRATASCGSLPDPVLLSEKNRIVGSPAHPGWIRRLADRLWRSACHSYFFQLIARKEPDPLTVGREEWISSFSLRSSDLRRFTLIEGSQPEASFGRISDPRAVRRDGDRVTARERERVTLGKRHGKNSDW
jgi:hypothetical protein